MHLQFLGFPIANDPVYQNSDAWGPIGGKGGVFDHDCRNGALGAMRGGGAGMRALRKELGDKFVEMKRNEEREGDDSLGDDSPGADSPNLSTLSEASTPDEVPELTRTLSETLIEDTTLATSDDGAPVPKSLKQIRYERKMRAEASKYNKFGRLKKQAREGDPYDHLDPDNGRHEADPPLTDAAREALRKLRSKKDERENWSVDRDRRGIELASSSSAPDEPASSDSGVVEAKGGSDVGFCSVCFTPLIPDPKPDQLYIWLHAMRYYTQQWDWRSEGPDWARPEWDGVIPDFAKTPV